jgi:hypothetical protein
MTGGKRLKGIFILHGYQGAGFLTAPTTKVV